MTRTIGPEVHERYRWLEHVESPQSPSTVEQLLRRFESHEEDEQRTLDEYRTALEQIEHPMARFVLGLIRVDEEKHREVVAAMRATLVQGIFWASPPAALSVSRRIGPERDVLLALTERFVGMEREGIKEYKRLLRQTRGMYDGLFTVLLRALIKDSEKHLLYLEFLQDYLLKHRTPTGDDE